MKRAYFQYYETFEKVVAQFSTPAEQHKFRSKIIEYGLYGTEPDDLTDKEGIAWVFIKDLIDDQVHRREVQAANRAKRSTPPAYTNGEPDQEPEAEEPKKKPREKFTPPTVEEVDAYCRERNNGITGQAFVDWYTNTGWKIGKAKSPMKDWKAAVRQWETRRKEEGRPAGISNDRLTPGAAFSTANKYQ